MGKYGMTTHGSGSHWKYDFEVGAFKKKNQWKHPIEDIWDQYMVPNFPWDWNDYGSMKEYSSYPFLGPIFSARADQLEWEENQQWLEDYAKNTGIKLDEIKYPIRAGMYRGFTSSSATSIAATRSIMSLYGNSMLMRWL